MHSRMMKLISPFTRDINWLFCLLVNADSSYNVKSFSMHTSANEALTSFQPLFSSSVSRLKKNGNCVPIPGTIAAWLLLRNACITQLQQSSSLSAATNLHHYLSSHSILVRDPS